jgi:peptidoglycan/LPS O-acetylase OafA/YrhL
MRISAYTIGRDNNFNLLRMIAATAVLVSHSYALTLGSASAEPFATSLGKSLGSIAVDVFFVSSGFLICASLINRPNAFQFVKARFLRIFPALFVVLLFTAFVIGPIYSSRSIIEYFSSLSVYRHVIQNAVLIFGIHYTLPGVFESNAFSAGVNGSLWTLPIEIKMYGALARISHG